MAEPQFEINVFIDDGVGHIKAIVAEPVDPETGIPTGEEPDVARVVALYNALTQALTADGAHKLGREAPRGGKQAGGGGAARPAATTVDEACGMCGNPTTISKTSKTGNQYLTCGKCSAIAPFKARDTGEWAWREDQPR